MKKKEAFIIFILLFCFLSPSLFAKTKKLRLYMQDGQIYNRYVRICVPDIEITEEMNPVLTLHYRKNKEFESEPIEVLPNQNWEEKAKDDKPTTRTGTVFIFNLSKIKMPLLYTCVHVIPILKWEDGEEVSYTAISFKEVVLGNLLGASIWTFLIVITFLLLLWIITKYKVVKINLLNYIGLATGEGSMSLFQIALWTIAVGYMVLWYGMMTQQVPNIPDTLLWIMLASSSTGLAGYAQTAISRKRKEQEGLTEEFKPPEKVQFSSIFMVNVKGNKYPSLAKAQLLFWTVITIIIFITKSALEGQLWNIPYQLVLLMGLSQVTLLGRDQMAIMEIRKPKPGTGEASSPEAGTPETPPEPDAGTREGTPKTPTETATSTGAKLKK